MAWKDPNRIKEWRREHKEELKQKYGLRIEIKRK